MKKTKVISLIACLIMMICSSFMVACGEVAVKEIKIKEGSLKSVYEVGETEDYSNFAVIATLEDGTTEEYSINSEKITYYSPIDTSSAGDKEFSVIVGGKVAKTTYKVVPAEAQLTEIRFVAGSKTQYGYNETFDASQVFIDAIYDDANANKTLALNAEGVEIVSQIDTTMSGEQQLKVTYGGKEAVLNVTVKVEATGLAFKAGTKTTYNFGESIDYSSIKVVLTYEDNTTKEVALTNTAGGASYLPIDEETAGKKNLIAGFEGKQALIQIEIVPVLESISIINLKNKFALGESVDYTSVKVQANYNDGSNRVLSLDTQGIEKNNISTSQVGEQTFTVNYNGKTASVVVNVVAPTVASISIIEGLKTEYKVGETFNAEEVKLLVTKDDSSTEYIYLDNANVSWTANLSKQGDANVVSVTYGGRFTSATIKVVAVLQSISFNVNAKTEYNYGEVVDYSSILLDVIYNDEDVNTTINLADSDVSKIVELDTNTLGEQTLKVSYKGKEATLAVKVNAVLTGIEFVDSVLEFDYASVVDYSNIKINVIFNPNSENKQVALNAEGVNILTPVNAYISGEQTLKVRYAGFEKEILVTVIPLLQEINFVENTLYNEYSYMSTIDYSRIQITLKYNDASFNKNISLTEDGVEIVTPIDTSSEGQKQLVVKYGGKTITATVNIVVISPNEFRIPTSYQKYLTESVETTDSVTQFAIGRSLKDNPYKVGSINKFEFKPIVAYTDWSIQQTVTIENPKTYIKLYEIDVETGNYTLIDNPATYVEVSDNMYKFNSDANGKTFRMEIFLDENVYDLTYWNDNDTEAVIVIEYLKVVEAYNVYNTAGLSVFDNLNVKNWASLKNRTLKWDDKKLSEYTDVKLVIMHNDIVINADELPSNYFWDDVKYGNGDWYDVALNEVRVADTATNGTTKFAERLKGSLKDGTSGEPYGPTAGYNGKSDELNRPNGEDYVEEWGCINMQKGFFTTNQCSLEGNFMTISTKDSATRHFTSVLSYNYKAGDIKEMTNPTGHWSIFKTYKTSDQMAGGKNETTVDISFNNLFIKGNMPKVNKQGIEVGLMAINTLIDCLTVNNVITSQFYNHITADGNTAIPSKLNFYNSRMSDAYSNMIFLWRSEVEVKNSILKNAGGPLFIMSDDNRTEGGLNDLNGPRMFVDDKSVFESYAVGTEAWYDLWNAGALFTQLKGMSYLLKNHKDIGKGIVHMVNGAQQVNVIAVIVPEPGSIMSPSSENLGKINIYGTLVRNNAEQFAMNDPIVSLIKSYGSVCFNSGNQYAYMPSETSVDLVSKVNPQAPSDFANKSTDWLQITMSANAKAGLPYFSAIIGDFSASSLS